jgi:hypothetical protein
LACKLPRRSLLMSKNLNRDTNAQISLSRQGRHLTLPRQAYPTPLEPGNSACRSAMASRSGCSVLDDRRTRRMRQRVGSRFSHHRTGGSPPWPSYGWRTALLSIFPPPLDAMFRCAPLRRPRARSSTASPASRPGLP